MSKFNYKKWIVENKHGGTNHPHYDSLNEQRYQGFNCDSGSLQRFVDNAYGVGMEVWEFCRKCDAGTYTDNECACCRFSCSNSYLEAGSPCVYAELDEGPFESIAECEASGCTEGEDDANFINKVPPKMMKKQR